MVRETGYKGPHPQSCNGPRALFAWAHRPFARADRPVAFPLLTFAWADGLLTSSDHFAQPKAKLRAGPTNLPPE